ncbi:hypothetical protein HDF16_006389 [Granulicella aggregans]|uniref:Uncharacterized protein n=1 Tax=Granulicella aggregans TaxID=474949 RepID=A0A7W8E6W7_9BACT|nr:hypothetical protein [Granulicella aggregans]MBB5061653.1 hypothetical protein [Granulicella aggregans]
MAAELLKPFDLRLNVADGLLKTIFIKQISLGNRAIDRELVRGSVAALPVLYKEDKEPYIRLAPLALGRIELALSGVFEDAAMFSKKLTIDVEPSNDTPVNIAVGNSAVPRGNVLRVHLSVDHPIGDSLVVTAAYPGVDDRVKIDSHFVKFLMRTEGDNQVVALDESTSTVKPTHAGHALIESSYGGVTVSTCVIVTDTVAQIGLDRSDCS